MKTSEVLEAARALIADPSDWGQGDNRESRPGTMCLVEAVSKVFSNGADDPRWDAALDALRSEAERQGVRGWRGSASGFNDTHTHDQVMSLLDSAISGARIRETAASSSASASVPGGGQDQT